MLLCLPHLHRFPSRDFASIKHRPVPYKMPNKPANRRSDQQPVLSFTELLSRDSDTAPPNDSACKKFLDTMQVKYDEGCEAKDPRREQACAILWAQVHRDDPDPPFSALSDAQRRQLVDALGLDAAALQKSTWPTVVVRRAFAHSVPGETPTKKRPSRQGQEPGPGSRRQLSKSGGRAGAGAVIESDAEVDSDEALELPQRGRSREPKSRSREPKSKRSGEPRSKRSGDRARSERSNKRSGHRRSRSSKRSRRRRSASSSDSERGDSGSSSRGSDTGSDSDSSSSSSSSSSSGGSSGRRRSPPARSSHKRGRSRSPARKATKGSKDSRTASVDSLSTLDEAQIDRLCAAKWLKGEELKRDLPPRWYTLLYCGHAWDNKKQAEYERARRRAGRGAQARREDPNSPAWVHRLSLVHSGDERLALDATQLALLVRGESMADFAGEDEENFRRREAYVEHLKTLRRRWQRVQAALSNRRLPGDLEITGVTTSIESTLARRYAAMKRAVGTRGAAATEVLANTARQCREVRAYFAQFKDVVNAHASDIEDYQSRVEYLGGRWLGLLRPAVEVVLSMESYDASKDALSLGRSAALATVPPTGQGSPPPKRTRKEPGADSSSQAAPAPVPQPTVSLLGAPAPPSAALACAAFPPMHALQPWGYMGPAPLGLGYAAPPLPPPPYQPPAHAASAVVAPSFATPGPGSVPAPAGPAAKRKVSFADGSAGRQAVVSGPIVKKEQEQRLHSPSSGFLGLPAHAWVCGANAAPPPPQDGSASFMPPCRCREELGFPGPHATWDCPLRYFERRGSCPGFFPSGQRDPSAWSGDNITEETKRRWKHFVSAHDGLPALEQARSARTGAPNFD